MEADKRIEELEKKIEALEGTIKQYSAIEIPKYMFTFTDHCIEDGDIDIVRKLIDSLEGYGVHYASMLLDAAKDAIRKCTVITKGY